MAVILIAEDNPDILENMREVVSLSGHDVLTASNGSDALELARQHQPDAILSDVLMPGLNGFELLQALRGDTLTRTIPVVLVSARVDESALIQGVELGADAYLTKPFTNDDLVNVLRNLFNRGPR
ncbi:MAG: response regulator [Chloroflexota bacterium]